MSLGHEQIYVSLQEHIKRMILLLIVYWNFALQHKYMILVISKLRATLHHNNYGSTTSAHQQRYSSGVSMMHSHGGW